MDQANRAGFHNKGNWQTWFVLVWLRDKEDEGRGMRSMSADVSDVM